MKTKEELNALKEEVETLNNTLADLNEEELEHFAVGGRGSDMDLELRSFTADADTVGKKSVR